MQINVFTIEFFVVMVGFLTGEANSTSLFYGGIVIGTGIFLLIWSSGHVRPGRVEGGDISGPWRFMRHPEVLSRFLMVFGFLLMARAAWVFAVSTLLLGWFYRRMVIEGDLKLAKWMGPQFNLYRLFVPSILPQFLPVKLPQQALRNGLSSMSWSIRKVWARRSELKVLILSIIFIAAAVVSVRSDFSWNWLRGACAIAFVWICYHDLTKFLSSFRNSLKLYSRKQTIE